MVCFVSRETLHADGVHAMLLDAPEDRAFDAIPFEQDAASLDLRAIEREFLDQGWSAMGHGYRVVGDEAPKRMLWPSDRPLPDVILYNFFAISPRCRDFIDRMEPGVHQFFPVAIVRSEGEEAIATYYWLNVCNRIDSIDADKTTYAWKTDYTGKGYWTKARIPDAKLVFSLPKIGKRHLWYDPWVREGVFCSETFAEAARSARITGLALSQRDEA